MTQDYKSRFFELALNKGNLRFGSFTLKSGRVSPYFFNAGGFDDGASLAGLAQCYADAILHSGVAFDMLFGPAYKGIPLAAAASIALAEQHGKNIPWCFNRKEAKDHGEGGNLVGSPLNGRILVIDDVITAGTAIRESVDIIKSAGAELVGVVIALDRQERGQGERSAIQEVEENLGINVASIVKLEHLLEYLKMHSGYEDAVAMIESYRDQYGV